MSPCATKFMFLYLRENLNSFLLSAKNSTSRTTVSPVPLSFTHFSTYTIQRFSRQVTWQLLNATLYMQLATNILFSGQVVGKIVTCNTILTIF